MPFRTWVKVAATASLLTLTCSASADGPAPALSPEACATTAEHATDLRDGGRLREAVASFAVCARDECPRIVREDCRRGLQSINDAGPHLIPKLRDAAGRDVVDAELTLDGTALSPQARARGILVDPGTHVVQARRERAVVAERTVLVTATDGLRTVDLNLDGSRSPSERKRPDHTVSWVVGGAGVALLAIGGVLGTWTYLDYRELERQCRPDCESSRIDPVRTRGIGADVTIGVGVVTMVTAVVLRLTEGSGAPPPRAGALSW